MASYARDSDVVLLNDFTLKAGRLGKARKDGTRRRGKQRMILEIRSEIVAVDMRAAVLGKAPAAAIVDMIRADLSNVSKTVSDRAIRQRAVDRRAFASGKPWAKKRFSGGRTGPTPPGSGIQWGTHSGRLAKTVVARFAPRADSFIVNVSANRLRPSSWPTQASFESFLGELKRQVPGFDPSTYSRRPEWKRALEQGMSEAVYRLKDAIASKKRQLRSARLGALKQGVQLLRF